MEIVHRSHSEHLVGNQVHKQCIFFKHHFALINLKIVMKTNKIHSCITKSIKNFIKEDNFKFVWLMEFVAPPKTWLWDLHRVKIICNADLKMLLSKKSHSLTLSANFCVTNQKIIEKVFSIKVEKIK